MNSQKALKRHFLEQTVGDPPKSFLTEYREPDAHQILKFPQKLNLNDSKSARSQNYRHLEWQNRLLPTFFHLLNFPIVLNINQDTLKVCRADN